MRSLRKSRGFAAATLLTLAVCLGANAAIFTVVDSVLLRPLPVCDADRIVALGDVYPFTPNDILSNDVPSYFDRRAGVPTLAEQAMFAPWFDTLKIDGVSVELRGMRATPSLFRLLQVQPIVGRTFDDAEGEVGAERKILLSHGLWQRLYGGDRSAVGKDLRLGWTGQRYTIVGVMPRGFSFFDRGADGHAQGPGDTPSSGYRSPSPRRRNRTRRALDMGFITSVACDPGPRSSRSRRRSTRSTRRTSNASPNSNGKSWACAPRSRRFARP